MKRIAKLLSKYNPLRLIFRLWHTFRNRLRKRHKHLDYIIFSLPVIIPVLPERRNFILSRIQGKPETSLPEYEEIFKRIVADPRTKGIILLFSGLEMSFADLQSLRDMIFRFRQSGKKTVAYASSYNLRTYYVASACDEILLQPGGFLMTLGLRQQQVYLKNGLDKIGVEFDVVQITPYKGAYDQLTLNEPSPEGSEQTNLLLDSIYETIVQDISESRGISKDAVMHMINTAPHMDREALDAGYVTEVANQEDLSTFLDTDKLCMWEKDAEKKVLKQWHEYHPKYVNILHLSGTILDGKSRKPPVDLPIPFLGGEIMGDQSVVQQIRALMRDENSAAVVLYVDSPGGSATASEAMTSALVELAQKRPVVVYMGNVAASGGYYISTPAEWIVAQSGTITGSIGVVMAKPVAGELLNKLMLNPVEYLRGENASLLSTTQKFTPEQHQQMRAGIERTYEQFVHRVAESRKMKTEEVDAIGGGRVWTGQQALENGLVDEIGGLFEAVQKARELADLPDYAPVVLVDDAKRSFVPQLAEEANPAATLRYLHDRMQSFSGRIQMLMPIEFTHIG